MAKLLNEIVDNIEKDKDSYSGKDVSVIINQMRYEGIEKEVREFAKKWFLPEEDVRYEVYHYRDGVIANENNLKEKVDYTAYKDSTSEPLPKFRFRSLMIEDFRDNLMSEILPLL